MGEAARSSSRTGRVIAGRYRIVKLLGRGGMAEVFLVEKVSDIERAKKLFALKRVLPQYADDPLRVSCFLDEVAVAATIDHPNIVHAHDWGQDEDAGGSLFLVMDFVRGMDLYRLGDKLAEHAKKHGARYPGQELGILPPEIVAWAILQAAIGLDYLHRQKRSEGDELGLIHRDISPDNIMMDIRGHVRVNDLGIAKALKGEQHQASATKHATGKPLYMPPEQWKGLPIDGTADLYALGITAFELLTRRHPYDNPALPNEDVMNKVVRAFQTDRQPIAVLAPEMPPPMQRMLEQLIRGHRAERQQSAAELFAPLKETIAGFGLDLHQVQQSAGALLSLVYERPDTIAEMPGYRSEPDPPLEAQAPAESEKRPISRPSGDATARAKPAARTTPLGEAMGDAAQPGTAPFAVAGASASPSGSNRSLKLAIAASLVVLLGLVSFGVAFFAWPSNSDPQVSPQARPEPATTAAPATTTAPAAVEPVAPAAPRPAAPSEAAPSSQAAVAAPPAPAPAQPDPSAAAAATPRPPLRSTPPVRPQPRLTPVPHPRMAPVPAPATRNRNDTSARQGDFGI